MPSTNDVSRSTAALQHLYEREVSFYQHLAASIATRTPHCYFAERDDTDNFLLLLEDLSPSAVIDQFVGVSIGTARAGLAALAGLHGPTHAKTPLHDAPWLRGVATNYGRSTSRCCHCSSTSSSIATTHASTRSCARWWSPSKTASHCSATT